MSKREVMKAMREALEAEGLKVVDFPISDELRGAQSSFVAIDDEEWNGEGDYSDLIEEHLRSKAKKVSDWMMSERLGVNDDVAGEAAKDGAIAVIGCDYGVEVTVMLRAARMVNPRMIELVYEADRPISAYRCGDMLIVDECHLPLDWSEVEELKKPPRLRLDDGRKAWQTCHGPAPRHRNVFGDCRKR